MPPRIALRKSLLVTEVSAASTDRAQLVPSELVYLLAPTFAPPKGAAPEASAARLPDLSKDNWRLLAERMLVAALLANEQAGNLRLELQPQKKLFGLRSVDTLTAVATERPPVFPAETLEARLYEHVTKQKTRSEAVSSLVCDGVGVQGEVLDAARKSLLAGGLAQAIDQVSAKKSVLGKTKEKHVTETRLVDRTIEAAKEQVAQAQALFEGAQRDRSDAWNQLVAAIKQGLARAVKKSDSSSDWGSALDNFGD